MFDESSVRKATVARYSACRSVYANRVISPEFNNSNQLPISRGGNK
jgi:hypothetical protein